MGPSQSEGHQRGASENHSGEFPWRASGSFQFPGRAFPSPFEQMCLRLGGADLLCLAGCQQVLPFLWKDYQGCRGRRQNHLFPSNPSPGSAFSCNLIGSRLWPAWLRRCLANHERVRTSQRGCAPPWQSLPNSRRRELQTGVQSTPRPQRRHRERIRTFRHHRFFRLFSPLPAEGRSDSGVIMFSRKPFLAAPTRKAGLLLLCVPVTPGFRAALGTLGGRFYP